MTDTNTNTDTVDDAIADAKENPASEAPVVLTKAEKAARRKADNAAKKEQAKKDRATATKAKADEKKAADKVKSDAKQLTIVQRDAKTLIAAGIKAMTQVGNGNLLWTVAAFKLRALTKGTGVNFKDEALEHWGVGKNTATKLANAGELLHSLTEAGGDKEMLAYMPMNNINNLSTIAGFSDKKLTLGIDTDVIKIDATEEAINSFNRAFDDNAKPVIVVEAREVPGTAAADAERDAAALPGGPVSESETPTQLIARLADAATDLTPANLIKLIANLAGNLKGKRVDDLFAALEKVHPAPEGE